MHEKKYGFSPFFYRNGLTFSVTSRDCAISQLTFSHGIAHNFGGIGNGGKTKKEITYIAYRKEIMRTNANLIYQIITKTTTGKFGMPSNDKHFSRNIATIAGLGDEYMLRKILYESRVQKTAHVVEGKLRVPIIQGNQGIQASKASRHYSCRQIFAFSQDT